MQLSNELPTAVDYTNILVNYIEVSADDIPKAKEEAKVPDGVYPPQVLPHGTEAKDHAPDSIGKTRIGGTEVKPEPVFWGKEMPPYLLDIDKPEGSIRQQRAARGQADFPPPPGLPLFLGKSILNGTTPMKDDSSVLNMPNHTVLNHLATSSIKNQVIATSLTTRYKRKVSSPTISQCNFAAYERLVCHDDRIQAHGSRHLKTITVSSRMAARNSGKARRVVTYLHTCVKPGTRSTGSWPRKFLYTQTKHAPPLHSACWIIGN